MAVVVTSHSLMKYLTKATWRRRALILAHSSRVQLNMAEDRKMCCQEHEVTGHTLFLARKQTVMNAGASLTSSLLFGQVS